MSNNDKANNEKFSHDEITPEQLESVAGGVSMEEEEEECTTFVCGSYSTKQN